MRLLLHTCCATCGSYVAKLLQDGFSVDVFFYNQNIYHVKSDSVGAKQFNRVNPREEYEKRLADVKKFCDVYNIKLIEGEYNHQGWLDYIKGFEASPEQGERCRRCYEFRLKKTAEYAKNNSYDFFTTTLSVSPHKKADIINKLGIELAAEMSENFYEADFKKKDGFKKSIERAKEFDFYRQNYCGCEFSNPHGKQ